MHKLEWRRLRNCGQTRSRFDYLENRAAYAPMLHTSQVCICTRLLLKHNNAWVTFFLTASRSSNISHIHIRPIIQTFGIHLTTAIENCFVFNYDVGTIEQHLLHVNKEITDVPNIINVINTFFCASGKRSYSSEV